MPKKFNGYEMPEFKKARYDEARIADLIAREEEDFLLWLEYAGLKKDVNKERGYLTCVDGEAWLVVREPYTGTRRACRVGSDEFLNKVHVYLAVKGSRSMREKSWRG